jgi:2-polyprenyl-6-methoxyphenol hydroxylase-like FAD-dependent oxidoreductase
LDEMLPGIRGVLDVGHPAACEALSAAAEHAGATVVRGIGDVLVDTGSDPTVRYELNDMEHQVSCRLIAGADGRMSTVRRQLGIGLTQTPPNSLGGGMLVEDLHDWPVNVTSIGTENDLLYFDFPREGGRARLYLLHDVAQKGRFAGPNRHAEFLQAFRLDCIPHSEMFAAATPTAVCAFYPMNDAWADAPAVPGAVLLGDAAGWSDPVIGQGLSIALRDARTVRDLVLDGARTPDAFASYGAERSARMERLRFIADVLAAVFAEDADNRPARHAFFLERREAMDPMMMTLLAASFAGPENMPSEAIDPTLLDQIRSA